MISYQLMVKENTVCHVPLKTLKVQYDLNNLGEYKKIATDKFTNTSPAPLPTVAVFQRKVFGRYILFLSRNSSWPNTIPRGPGCFVSICYDGSLHHY